MKGFFRTALASLLFIITVPALAATTTPATTPTPHPLLPTPQARPAQLSSCFDYYRFGSVPATISTSLSSVAQGSTLGFSGTLQNQNNYPIVDATVYIKIFHIRSQTKDVNGPDVVDFFPALAHVTLNANQTIPLSFTWKVPTDLEPGDYQAVTYVNSSDRFELQGLAFTDDVVGNNTDFTVVGDDIGALRFDKDSVLVDGKPFYFAAFPPTIPTDTVNYPVSAAVANTTDNPIDTKVTWSLYYWDSLSQSHLIDTETDELKVFANSTTTVSYTVKDRAHTVYYLVGDIVSAQGSQSIIGVRFVRADVNEPRFNFVTIEGSTAIACIHSTGNASADNSNVTLTVTPNVWYAPLLSFFHLGTLASASYSGSIPGDIYALTAPIKGTASSYTVHADLSQKGKSIDSFSENYTCSELGTKCPSPMVTILYAVIPLVLILLLIAGFVYWRIKKRNTSSAEMTTPTYTIP